MHDVGKDARGNKMASLFRSVRRPLLAAAILISFTLPAIAVDPGAIRPVPKTRATAALRPAARSGVRQVSYSAAVSDNGSPLGLSPQLAYDGGDIRYLTKPPCWKDDVCYRCLPSRWCPRGTCGQDQTGCDRLDYSRYVLFEEKSNYKQTRIGAALHPEYQRHCRDFWLRDSQIVK